MLTELILLYAGFCCTLVLKFQDFFLLKLWLSLYGYLLIYPFILVLCLCLMPCITLGWFCFQIIYSHYNSASSFISLNWEWSSILMIAINYVYSCKVLKWSKNKAIYFCNFDLWNSGNLCTGCSDDITIYH